MATEKPRITVTLEPETYEIIKGISKVQRISMSKFINETFTEMSPALGNMLSLLQAAESAPKEVIARYKGIMETETDRYQSFIRTSEKQLDWVVESVGNDRSQPPYINKGVRYKTGGEDLSNDGGSVVSGRFSGKSKK